jgi:hypothetical protein
MVGGCIAQRSVPEHLACGFGSQCDVDVLVRNDVVCVFFHSGVVTAL